MELRVKKASRIDLEITVPGDKSISHRAVIVAALSNGVCTLKGFLPSEDCMHTVNEMRATVVAEGPDGTPPLRISGGSLRGIQYRPSVASAQVKGALLLAGLFARGKTTVEEPIPTRNHMEKMLNYFLVRTTTEPDGSSVNVFGDQVPESRDFDIPGDISSAAFWLITAAAQPRGHLLI